MKIHEIIVNESHIAQQDVEEGLFGFGEPKKTPPKLKYADIINTVAKDVVKAKHKPTVVKSMNDYEYQQAQKRRRERLGLDHPAIAWKRPVAEREIMNSKMQKFKQSRGELSPVGTTTSDPPDSAKEKVEQLAKKK